MSPPRPVEQGSVTARVAATAMAASAALAPFLNKSKPMDVASGCDDATHPLRHNMGDRREVKGSGLDGR